MKRLASAVLFSLFLLKTELIFAQDNVKFVDETGAKYAGKDEYLKLISIKDISTRCGPDYLDSTNFKIISWRSDIENTDRMQIESYTIGIAIDDRKGQRVFEGSPFATFFVRSITFFRNAES